MIASIIVAQTAGLSLGAVLRQVELRFLTGQLQTAALGVVALGSAIGAASAGGSPTGWAPLDVILAAALGGGLVWIGALASTRMILLATVAACVAGIGSEVHPVAFAASGLVLASAVAASRDPIITAVVSAMVVQVAVRLEHPQPPGLTAVAATVILAPIIVSGFSQLAPEARHRLVRGGLLLGVVGIMAAAVAASTALGARASLNRGAELLGSGTALGGQVAGQELSARLAAADDAFTRAQRILRWSRPAAMVPVVAQHWRAMHDASLSGQTLSRTGARTASSTTVQDLRIRDGHVPLDKLAALGPTLDDAATALGSAYARLSGADSDWLLPPLGNRLRKAKDTVGNAEAGVRDAARALPMLPALLGDPVPRRYFLMIQTPAELRATGGFMGNYGEITAERGRLSLSRFGRIIDLYPENSAEVGRLEGPPDYVARYAAFHPEQELGNVNLSPDLPTVARVVDGLYTHAGGRPTDGVIAVDPSGLAAFLKLIGPVQVASWPEPITSENVERILLFDQYQQIQSPERKDFLGEVAQEVWRRLTTGSSLTPQQLFAALGQAVRGKHLQMVTTQPHEEALFNQLGVSGRLAPVEGDFLAVVTQNAGGNKLDAYLHRQVDYRVELDPGTRVLRARLRLTLDNRAPANGLPAYVNGMVEPPLPEGYNRLYVSVYTPWRLSSALMEGSPLPMAAERELGRRVYSTYVVIPPGGSTTLELTLDGRLAEASQYVLQLHRQPTVEPDDLRTSLMVPSGWAVGDGSGRRWSSRRPFDDDETVRLPLRAWWR
ncbi:MAG: DUF4012 domain-containing protein [Actinomycetota bacterium]|nr:DUF4012 domain-containing protein [Actinomycetota bacterium]